MRAAMALALVVPVVATALLVSRRAAYVVAAAATIVFSLLVPPVGSVGVRLTEDLVGLVVFFGVALVITTLVASRVETFDRVEEQRRALLRSVSHDLRTPLSSIRSAVSELRDGDHHDAHTEERLLEMVDGEAERLDRLVANLLSLSRIEGGAFEPRRQTLDVAELLEFCTQRLAPLFKDRVLDVSIAPDLRPIEADYSQLDQVVTNLLENAARHSGPGGVVSLTVAPTAPGGVAIVVTDSGEGLDPATVGSLFEPFRSGARGGSSGIGLAICKAVVEAHGGTIAADGSPGGGARFSVTLPPK